MEGEQQKMWRWWTENNRNVVVVLVEGKYKNEKEQNT